MPGFPVHHQLPELTQTDVHQVGDVIQPSHPLSSPSLPALNLSQHQGLFERVSSLHQVAKVLEFQLQHQSNEYSVLISFRVDWFDLLAVQETLKSLLQHHGSKARWSIPKSGWLYSLQPKMEKLYTVSKTRLGADCGSDHDLLITKFRVKLKKVGKTARPFRYDLNQIPYDYTVEVTNRFKGLDLTECLKNYGWRFMTLYSRQLSRPSPRESDSITLTDDGSG